MARYEELQVDLRDTRAEVFEPYRSGGPEASLLAWGDAQQFLKLEGEWEPG